jgi:hypothetical protein
MLINVLMCQIIENGQKCITLKRLCCSRLFLFSAIARYNFRKGEFRYISSHGRLVASTALRYVVPLIQTLDHISKLLESFILPYVKVTDG